MNTKTQSIPAALAAGILVAAACVATPVLADAPQAVTISTQVVFDPHISGTFVATGPICPSGTLHFVDEHIAIGPAAFNVNATTEFVCDDNTGTFVLRLHPQANGRPKDGFDLNGPWSVWGKGTGDYENLSGQGAFGAVFDFDSDPLVGEETYVGFVNLH
ncbi:MAG TPA: hypothetical protein VFG52_10775 [Xanthomonadales bacterium]|nr:hypothetical protein [Xanthomonadales bacterium]